MRDIEKYANEYLSLGYDFEQYQVQYRKKRILESIETQDLFSVLEIGCGMNPFFTELDENIFSHYVVVEPGQQFYLNACRLSRNTPRITCIHDTFDLKLAESHVGVEKYTMILLSSLLHEVEQPGELLDAVHLLCDKDTVVHINVPNANSFHRLLAKAMGMISDTHTMSVRNSKLQQNVVFDQDSLQT